MWVGVLEVREDREACFVGLCGWSEKVGERVGLRVCVEGMEGGRSSRQCVW